MKLKLFGINLSGSPSAPSAAPVAARGSTAARTQSHGHSSNPLGHVALTLHGSPEADPDAVRKAGEFTSARRKTPVPDVMHLPPHFTCALGRKYWKRHGSLDAASVEFVAARNAEYLQVEAKLMELHATNVVADWNRAVERGEIVGIGNLEDFKLARQMRSKALKRELAGIMAELLPIQHELAAKIGAFAAELADEFQERESAHLADFGMDYQPSRLVTLLRYAAKNHGQLINVSSGLPPEKALAWAGIQVPSIK